MRNWKFDLVVTLIVGSCAGFWAQSIWIGLAFFWIAADFFDTADVRIRCRALELRLADLDRDVTALEASTYGDGK